MVLGLVIYVRRDETGVCVFFKKAVVLVRVVVSVTLRKLSLPQCLTSSSAFL